ncbi:MAG: serine/threonine-protein kinase [Parvibaculaceae bacterium]|nr:serine/threonine-protein kinase [Parvibaculaceae bacterium]|tara:strand:+ start:15131 stop:17341 length:2211 start_codon:yes stop_codon:yes gene_type:complete
MEHLNALVQGTELDGYRIEQVLGSGGFGITYLGLDLSLQKLVAIKEYLPSDLAVRQQTLNIAAKSEKAQSDFQWGLERFLDEARTLAQFDDPHIVKVIRFFRAHGSAYIVMDYVAGETLAKHVEREGQIKEEQLQELLEGLLSGVELIHAAGVLHRDIAPGNIIISSDGTPVLIDFGSARQIVKARSRALTSIVTPGYAPIEQYSDVASQGPWTDIYSLGAIFYRLATGDEPLDATARVPRDSLIPASEHDKTKGNYKKSLLVGIDASLSFDYKNRPQNVSELRALLDGQDAQATDNKQEVDNNAKKQKTSPQDPKLRSKPTTNAASLQVLHDKIQSAQKSIKSLVENFSLPEPKRPPTRKAENFSLPGTKQVSTKKQADTPTPHTKLSEFLTVTIIVLGALGMLATFIAMMLSSAGQTIAPLSDADRVREQGRETPMTFIPSMTAATGTTPISDEEAAWVQAQRLGSINGYKTYLAGHQIHAEDARKAWTAIANEIIDLQFSLGQLNLYFGSLDGIPGPLSQRAVNEFSDAQNLPRLELNDASESEIAAFTQKVVWRNSEIEDSVDAYNDYLKLYPDGDHYDDAQSKLAKVRETISNLQQTLRDVNLYTGATDGTANSEITKVLNDVREREVGSLPFTPLNSWNRNEIDQIATKMLNEFVFETKLLQACLSIMVSSIVRKNDYTVEVDGRLSSNTQRALDILTNHFGLNPISIYGVPAHQIVQLRKVLPGNGCSD